ncbi:MAG: hypothetical protein ISR76_06820 [Planctomycetes bacterium]|nr:hypothetical protein [Planctomycetota bacterium]
MRSFLRSLLCALFLLTALPVVSGQDYLEDARLGFKIKPPKDWEQIPVSSDQSFEVGKFVCDKTYFMTDEATGYTYEHRPELKIVSIIHDSGDVVTGERGEEEAEEAGGGDDPGDGETIKIDFGGDVKDYHGYMRSTYTSAGWHVAEEEPGKEKDYEYTDFTIAVERGSRGGAKRVVTRVYHLDGVDVAVQFEMWEESYSKLKSTISKCLKTFKLIERQGELGKSSFATLRLDLGSLDDMSPAERKDRRKEMELSEFERAKLNLPEDWVTEEIDGYLVLNHADKKFAKKVIEQAQGTMEWLDETFDYVGSGEYVRRPYFRICKDWEEEARFRQGRWFGMSTEITTNKGTSGATSSEWDYINARCLEIWFGDRDRELWMAMPAWLKVGLGQVVRTARLKGRSMELKPSEWEKIDLREAVRNGTNISPSDLMKMGIEELSSIKSRAEEATALVRFLLSKGASRTKVTKNLMTEYLLALQDVVDEMEKEAEEAKKDDDGPQTEEEEEAAFQAKQQAWKLREEQVLKGTFERVFAGWQEKDWDAFYKAYYKTLN